jgi:hypothetical protein
MFGWLQKKKEVLEFRDSAAAFAKATEIGYQPLVDALIPALVEEEGGLGRDGERTFLVRLATGQAAAQLWTCTLKESPASPREGDFVGFRVVTIASDLPEPANLIGYIACKLQPVLVAGRGWRVAQSYTPKEIKQAIRF